MVRKPEQVLVAGFLRALALMIFTANYLSLTFMSTRCCRVTVAPPQNAWLKICWPAPTLVLHLMVLVLLSMGTEGEFAAQEIHIGPGQIVACAVSLPLPCWDNGLISAMEPRRTFC